MKVYTPLRAIRKYCMECSGNQWSEVEQCVIPECPLYSWRFGKRLKTVEKHRQKRILKASSGSEGVKVA